MSQFQQAMQAISARPLTPSALEQELVEQSGRQMAVAVERINRWLENEWKNYASFIQSSRPNPFQNR
jgi:hypothetical protein